MMQSASLTPPPTVTKPTLDVSKIDSNLKPKSLLNTLKRQSNRPFHLLKKNRLEPNTILNLNDIIEQNLHQNSDLTQNKRIFSTHHSQLKKICFLKSVLNNCSNMIVITGAGISTDCGIPDFRSTNNGLFTNSKKNKYLFDSTNIYSTREQTLEFNKLINNLYHLSTRANPTPFHKLLDSWTQSGRIRKIYTQNIDSIENKLNSFNNVNIFKDFSTQLNENCKLIPLHGTIKYTQCNKCYIIEPLQVNDFPIMDNIHETINLIPLCSNCKELDQVRQIAGMRSRGVGQLRPKIVLYNEPHPEGEIIAKFINEDIKCKSLDCLLIVGTTLEIPGVKEIVNQLVKLKQSGKQKKLVIIFISNELPNAKIRKLFGDVGIDLIVHGNCQDLVKLID